MLMVKRMHKRKEDEYEPLNQANNWKEFLNFLNLKNNEESGNNT